MRGFMGRADDSVQIPIYAYLVGVELKLGVLLGVFFNVEQK